MNYILQFEPEKHWLYSLRVWLATKLWKWSYRIHPYPPMFHNQVANDYSEAEKQAHILLEDLKKNGRSQEKWWVL